ncbi:helix-turn-helix domain-containing protein [Stutzerimonas nitrititolerans]|uniref:helix-turn-helix domain-containing protein n=1 Tax=Stutzerimonas nitrititolerans TaxID=2482751 RepID=UPI0028A13A54|nr:helix-turn-helix domain-containing protein [Stutzerimonas nitrititolerans]
MIAPQSEAAVPSLNNPGETLRIARESKNLSLQSVAQQLNLSERALARIEAGDFSQLPGHTFARGYVRAYAKLLGLDQNRLVQEFDQHTGTTATGSSVNSLGHIDQPVRLSRNMVRFFLFALLLLLIGGGFYWWQDQQLAVQSGPAVTALERIEVEAADGTTEIHLLDRTDDEGQVEQESETAEPSSTPEEPVPTVDPEAAADEPQAINESASTDQAPSDSASQPVDAPVAAEAPVQNPQAAAAPGEGVLELRYTADCWTQVTDADGRVLLSVLAKAGTSRTVSGKAPLDLRLGYASGAQVTYNGEAVSLSGQTRGETARLKLGQ